MITARLVQELAALLPRSQAPRAADVLTGAARDLRGSISQESLPEMAFRLALYRLTGAAPAGSSPREA